MNDTLIDKIVCIEWDLFTQVHNIGGQADCQQDFHTFSIMRKSQYQAWSEEALSSWLDDLHTACTCKRNLLSEKYAWMMRDTSPAEFKQIQAYILPLSEEKESLVRDLTQMQVRWREEFRRHFPKLSGQGRAIRQKDARSGETSVETYARGEFSTYSEKTLRLLKRHFLETEHFKGNPCYRTMEYMVKQYGYSSLDEAEHFL